MKELFLQIANMSITASWLVVVIALIRFVFKKAPKSMICFLWVFVAIRLIVPFSFESAFSLIPSTNMIPDEIIEAVPDSIGTVQTPSNNEIQVIIPNQNYQEKLDVTVPSADSDAQLETKITWIEVVPSVWIIGIIVMAGYAIYSYQKIYHQVQVSINTEGNIWICDDLSSPFILGTLNPKIYVPSYLNETELKYVLAHERAHLKRLDHWWKPLGYILLTIYWFNPVIWAAYFLLCSDIEMACDEKVIKTLGEQNKIEYSRALLSCSVPRNMILACPLAFGEVSVKQRVKSVLNYKKPAFWVLICVLVICVAIPVFFLSDPKYKVPEKVRVIRLEDGMTFDLTQDHERELLANLMELSYTESQLPWSYEYEFELDGSIYEVMTKSELIRIRKDGKYFSRIEDKTLLNEYLIMFGESPETVSDEKVTLKSSNQMRKVTMTDLSSKKTYSIDQWTETIVSWFENDAVKVMDADLQTYLNKQSTLVGGNELFLSLSLCDGSGNELSSFELFEEGNLIAMDGKLAVIEKDTEFLKEYLEPWCEDCTISAGNTDAFVSDPEVIKLLGFDPMQADNMKALGKVGGMGVESDNVRYQSVYVYEYYMELQNGRLRIIKIQTGESHVFSQPSDFIALASYSTCDGYAGYVYGLTASGEVYRIYTDHYYNYWDGQFEYTFEEGLSEVLRPFGLKEKVVALALKDDTDPYTTCGGFTVYGVDSEGRIRTLSSFESGNSYEGNERKDIHPYTDFLRVETERGRTPHPMGTEEAPVTYLLFMEDGSAMLGYDYGEFDLRWDNEFLTYNNEVLKFTRVVTEINIKYNEGNVFLIDDEQRIFYLMIDESDGEEIELTYMGEMETLIFEVNEKGNQICRGIKRTDGTTIDVASKYTNFTYLSDESKLQDKVANGEASVNTVEIWDIILHGDEEWVYFGAQNPSDNFDVALPAGTLSEFRKGDVVEVIYTTREVPVDHKTHIEYQLLSIKKTEGLYEKSHTFSEIVGFKPVSIKIEQQSLSGTEVIMIDSVNEIQFFMKRMDEVPVYEDYVEQFGAGGTTYAVTLTGENGETIEIENDLIVRVVDSSGSEKFYGPHRTASNNKDYSDILYELCSTKAKTIYEAIGEIRAVEIKNNEAIVSVLYDETIPKLIELKSSLELAKDLKIGDVVSLDYFYQGTEKWINSYEDYQGYYTMEHQVMNYIEFEPVKITIQSNEVFDSNGNSTQETFAVLDKKDEIDRFIKELDKVVFYEDPLLEPRFVSDDYECYIITFEDESGLWCEVGISARVTFNPHKGPRNYYCYHFTEDVLMIQDVIKKFIE